MGESQEKWPTLLQLWAQRDDDCGQWGNECVNRSQRLSDRLECAIGENPSIVRTGWVFWTVAEALLDKLDEAKHEHDECLAEVTRLRNAIDHADENARDWECAESERRDEVLKRDARIANLERERNECRANWATLFARLREVGVHVRPDSTGNITEIDQIVRAVDGLRGDIESLKGTNEQRESYWRGRVAGLEAERDEAQSSAEHFRRSADRVCSKADEARAEVDRLRASRSSVRQFAVSEEARAYAAESRVAELEAEVDRWRGGLVEGLQGASLPDLEEACDQQPLDTLDDVALALSGIRGRLARLEDRNG